VEPADKNAKQVKMQTLSATQEFVKSSAILAGATMTEMVRVNRIAFQGHRLKNVTELMTIVMAGQMKDSIARQVLG